MKNSVYFFCLLITLSVTAQKKNVHGQGSIFFEASVPMFEEIKATNQTVYCVLNSKTGEIHSTSLIKDFHFKIALMEKHFNDYYIQSDRYPKAIFKGRIIGFNWNIIGNSYKEFKLKGRLEINGERKEIHTTVQLRKVNNNLEFVSKLIVNANDFNIEIPSMLSVKISEKVTINTSFLFKV